MVVWVYPLLTHLLILYTGSQGQGQRAGRLHDLVCGGHRPWWRWGACCQETQNCQKGISTFFIHPCQSIVNFSEKKNQQDPVFFLLTPEISSFFFFLSFDSHFLIYLLDLMLSASLVVGSHCFGCSLCVCDEIRQISSVVCMVY